MMPNFRNVKKQEMDFLRGYMTFYSAGRSGFGHADVGGFGAEFKKANTQPGPWNVFMMMQGETIPKESNQVSLSKDQKDEWGIPLLQVSVDYDENDEKILLDFHQQGEEMLEKAGCVNIRKSDSKQAPGLDIHEMGGVRMGRDPQTSLLNGLNQMHHAPNVFVTDGACMTSTGTQNPSITYMALTARAVDRSWVQQIPEVRFIFSGSHRTLMEAMFTEKKRPFYQSSILESLQPISIEAYSEFITQHFQVAKKKIELDSIAKIYHWSRGQTYTVQLVCNHLYAKHKKVTNADVDVVFDRSPTPLARLCISPRPF